MESSNNEEDRGPTRYLSTPSETSVTGMGYIKLRHWAKRPMEHPKPFRL